MRINNNNITCYRGEVFTLDFLVVNEDGSPYILPDLSGASAYVLINIFSNNYNEKERFKRQLWLNFDKQPTSVNTNGLEVKDFRQWPPKKPDGTTYDKLVAEKNIFYLKDGNDKIYKYYDCVLDEETGEYFDYEFRVVVQFSNSFTKEFIPQDYFYNVQLIIGNRENSDDEDAVPKFSEIIEKMIIIPTSKLMVYSDGEEVQ